MNQTNEQREQLEQQVGQVWNTEELQNDYDVIGFSSPFVVVTRKSDGAKGSLQFSSRPRFYFAWHPDLA